MIEGRFPYTQQQDDAQHNETGPALKEKATCHPSGQGRR
jgi:hypothetical protein